MTTGELCIRDHAADDRIVAWQVGYSEEALERLLNSHPSYYRSVEYFICGISAGRDGLPDRPCA